MKNARLTYEELSTVLIEIESITNSRPLTYMSEDCVEAITPFHLLHGRNIAVRRGTLMAETSTEPNTIGCRTKHVEFLINQYWKRFYNEYTLALRERMLYDKTSRGIRDLILGDIVIIIDDKKKPTLWKKGRIIEFIKGRDLIVRGVKLQSTTPTGRIIQISRPIQKVIPLEIAPVDNEISNIEDDDIVNNDETSEAHIATNDIQSDINTTNFSSNEPEIITSDVSYDFDGVINDFYGVTDDFDCVTDDLYGVTDNISNDSLTTNYVRPRRNAAVVGEIQRRFQN